MASATQTQPITSAAIATPSASSITPATTHIKNVAVRSVVEFLLALGLPAIPVAPAQDIEKYHSTKSGKQVAMFTGKNPSYLDRNGKPHTINHKQYQKRLPSAKELKTWFANPTNGIGTLGGINGIYWLDFDTKNFDSPAKCNEAVEAILDAHPALKRSWLERTHSGGDRVAVKPKEKPSFTNFALEAGGKHRGEALGEGRFTVLAPTIGVSGSPYTCLNLAEPIEIESLEAIGIFPVKSDREPRAPQIAKRQPIAIAGSIALEQLGNDTAAAALQGDDFKGDRSGTLTTAYREWSGWENWAANNGIAISGTATELAHQAGEALGLDADKVDRILKGIKSTSCQPAAQHKGGDEACWKKIRRLDRDTFDAAAPSSVRDALEALYAKPASGSGNPPAKGGFGNGGDGGNGDDEGDNEGGEPIDPNPDAFFKQMCKRLKLPFEYCVTRQQFDGSAYRNLFGADRGDWTVIDSAFYRWKGTHWQSQTDGKINKLICDYGEKTYKINLDRDGNPYITRPYENNKHKESAFKYCRSRLERDISDISNTHLLGFNDCVVDLRTGETMPHRKDLYLLNVIPCDYKPNADCPAIFRDFIKEAFGEEMLEVIRAFTAMFLDPTAPFYRCPHLIGQSGGGKGTLGRFWNNLFGAEGSGSSNNFADLSTPEGRHQYLTGKRIFGFPDMGGFCQGLRAFYELVDNGAMSGRALFSPTAYSKCWNIRFWLGSVGYLQVENAGDGWARRAYPIPVIDRFVTPDPHLGEKLEAVKAEVISWALAMPRAERDVILLSPPTCERSQNAAREAALFGDSTRSFVELCLRPTSEAGVTVTNEQLHSWYEAYCRIHGYAPMGMSKFVSHLKTVLRFNHVERAWQRNEAGERVRLSAHWKAIVALPGVFTSVTEVNAGIPQNPQWTCLKSQCAEGGLEAFEEFWNPTPPDSILEASQLQESPKPLHGEPGQDVQAKNSTVGGVDSLKPLSRETVQGVQGVQSKSFGVENQGSSESVKSEQAPAIQVIPTQVSAIDPSEEGATVTGQPGHPGQSHSEPVSAIAPRLDKDERSLDTLDKQPPELLSPKRLANAVAMLSAIDSPEAFRVFYECYQRKTQVQKDQIMAAAPEADVMAFYEWWNCPEVQALSVAIETESAQVQAASPDPQTVSEAAIASSPDPALEAQPGQKAVIERVIAAMSGLNCWHVSDYQRMSRQFEEAVLLEAIAQLDPRDRETIERHRSFIARNG